MKHTNISHPQSIKIKFAFIKRKRSKILQIWLCLICDKNFSEVYRPILSFTLEMKRNKIATVRVPRVNIVWDVSDTVAAQRKWKIIQSKLNHSVLFFSRFLRWWVCVPVCWCMYNMMPSYAYYASLITPFFHLSSFFSLVLWLTNHPMFSCICHFKIWQSRIEIYVAYNANWVSAFITFPFFLFIYDFFSSKGLCGGRITRWTRRAITSCCELHIRILSNTRNRHIITWCSIFR